MPKIKLPDLSDVEDVGTFNDMPKGLYVMKIREMTVSETGENSKSPGQPMGVIVLDPVRVVGGAKVKQGEYQGLFHRFPLDDSNPGWTPRLKEFVKAVGGKLKGGVIDEKAVAGKLVIVKVKDGKAEDGERRAELGSLMPYTEEAAGGAVSDDDDEDGAEDLWTEDELKELSSDDLRDAAEELEVEVPAKLGPKAKAKVIASILEAQEEEEEEDEDDDEESDEEPWDEESLLALGKEELTEVAGEFEVEMPGRLTSAAKKRTVEAILEAQGGDEEEETDEDDGDDEEEYDEDGLKELSLAELKEVATEEFELEVPKGKAAIVKKKLIAAILESQEEADEDDEEEDEDEDEEDDGYEDMTKTQLAKEVRSRGGKVKSGMSEEAMKEWLREQDGDDEDDDDDDDDLDPEEMSLDEIKSALNERGIATKGSLKVLRAKLTKALAADDDGDPF